MHARSEAYVSVLYCLEKFLVEHLQFLLLIREPSVRGNVVTLSTDPLQDYFLVRLSDLTHALDHFIDHKICVTLLSVTLRVTIQTD